MLALYSFRNAGESIIHVQMGNSQEIPFLKFPTGVQGMGYEALQDSAPFTSTDDGFAMSPSDTPYGILAVRVGWLERPILGLAGVTPGDSSNGPVRTSASVTVTTPMWTALRCARAQPRQPHNARERTLEKIVQLRNERFVWGQNCIAARRQNVVQTMIMLAHVHSLRVSLPSHCSQRLA